MMNGVSDVIRIKRSPTATLCLDEQPVYDEGYTFWNI